MTQADRSANPFLDRLGGLERGTMQPVDADVLQTIPPGCLLDRMDIRLTHAGPGAARAEMRLGPHHMNQAGVAQAGAVVSLADGVAGWACKAALPDERAYFTTLELKTNLLRAAREGTVLVAVARPVHLGRTTMVLHVDVRELAEGSSEGKLVAVFGCTQLVVTPPAPPEDREPVRGG